MFARLAEAVPEKSTKAMIKLISLLTFALVLGAVAVGFLWLPETDAVAAHEGVAVRLPDASRSRSTRAMASRGWPMRPVCNL